jgi:hypothetical protein
MVLIVETLLPSDLKDIVLCSLESFFWQYEAYAMNGHMLLLCSCFDWRIGACLGKSASLIMDVTDFILSKTNG